MQAACSSVEYRASVFCEMRNGDGIMLLCPSSADGRAQIAVGLLAACSLLFLSGLLPHRL